MVSWVTVAHVNQAALAQLADALLAVLEADRAVQHAASQVEFLAKRKDVDRVKVEPFPLFDTEAEREPVGKIDQILVFHLATGNLGGAAIEAPGQIGAGIVNPIGRGLRGGSAGAEVTVAYRAKRFTQLFLPGLEPLVNQRPVVHEASRLSSRSVSCCRNLRTSSGSSRA